MLTDERIEEIVHEFPAIDWSNTTSNRLFARAIEAEVRAEAIGCTRSHPHENMSAECEAKTVEARKVFMEAQEPVAYVMTEEEQSRTTLKTPIIVLGNLPRGANLCTAPQPPAPCPDEYERGKEDGWEACETCHGIVDGKHLGSVALQAKVAELSEELEEWRMTNKIDELYRELDANKTKVAEQHAEIERMTSCVSSLRSENEAAWEALNKVEEKRRKAVRRMSEIEENRDAWRSQVGSILATVPLSHVLRVSGTIGDAINYFKGLHSTIAQQAALIEKCEKALVSAVEWGAPMREAPTPSRPYWFDKATIAIAAIAAHRGKS